MQIKITECTKFFELKNNAEITKDFKNQIELCEHNCFYQNGIKNSFELCRKTHLYDKIGKLKQLLRTSVEKKDNDLIKKFLDDFSPCCF